MGIASKLKKGLKNPHKFLTFALRKWGGWIGDERYLRMMYRLEMGRPLRLDPPTTYNEKLQWLKLHDRRPVYTRMVDKVTAKEYAAEHCPEVKIIPTLGVWERVEDIDFDSLPQQFVLKCNHNSGGLVICKDKSLLDIPKARRTLRKALKEDYYKLYREWPYKNVPRRILAEQFMVDESGTELKDYKFFCFDGEVKMLFVATDRPFDTRFDFYDADFNHLPFRQGHPWATKKIVKPKGFEKMKRIASQLSAGLPHVRVDLYNINGDIYFGELTINHFSGIVPFEPDEWDGKIGALLKSPPLIHK